MPMPAIRMLSPQETDWIVTRHPAISIKEVAEYLSCHSHTAIRILVRLGLMKAPSDKYQNSNYAGRLSTVERKCLVCHKPKQLNKNIFICQNCRKRQDKEGFL